MQIVTVITSQPLSKSQLAAVEKLVKARIGAATIKQDVDPNVLGGVRLKIGTQEFDATTLGKLQKLERVSDTPIAVTAVALSAAQREEIVKTLETKVGTTNLQEIVDPSVLGGIKLIVGSQEYDGTITGKLERIKQHMLKSL